MSDITETPPETHSAATQVGAVPRRSIVLLGTVISPNQPTALVRMQEGDIRTLTLGDTVGHSTVLAIETGMIVLSQGPNTRKLTIPEG